MRTADRWVRMAPEEYEAYKANASHNIDAFKCGFDDGYSRGYEQGFRAAKMCATPEDLEVENDENWND